MKNLSNIFKKIFSKIRERKRSKETVTYIPTVTLQVTKKRMINVLDRIANKTTDFIGIVKNFHDIPLGSPKMILPDFGNIHDCYRTEFFSQTAINRLAIFIENTIQLESKARLEFIAVEAEYFQLTSLDLTHDLKAVLDEFSKTKQGGILANAKNNAKEVTLSGLQTEKTLLETENPLYELRKIKEQNNKEFASQVNQQFATIAEKVLKDYARNKTEENPQLGEIQYKKLKKYLAVIRNLNGGNGKSPAKNMGVIKDASTHHHTSNSKDTNANIDFNTGNHKNKIDYDRF